MFSVFAVILAVTITWNSVVRIARRCLRLVCKSKLTVSARDSTAKIVIADLRSNLVLSLFEPILRIGVLQRLEDHIEERMKKHILRSGSAQNPRLLGIKSVLYPLVACIVAVPIVIVILLVYGGLNATVPLAAAAFVPIPALFGFYFVMLKIKAGERKTRVEEEIAPFATLASIMESVGVSLFSTLEMVAASKLDVLPAIRNEGRRIKNLGRLGRGPTESLMELADSHPSVMFRNFLEGYVSSFNTGGSDTSKYLQEQAQRFFRYTQLRMTGYAKQADMIAQVILTVMLLLPMMGMSMTFFATGAMAATTMIILIVVFPFISVVLIVMVHAKQPKTRNPVSTSWVVFVGGAAVAILVYFLRDGGQMWEAMGAGIVAGSFLNMFLVRKRISESASAERQLPEFMRSITRFKNIGIDIMSAIRQMRHQSSLSGQTARFGSIFDGIINRLYMMMAAGSSFEQAVSKLTVRSWNVRLVFFILGKVHESGGGTTKTFDDITRWVTDYEDSKKEMIASLRASLVTAFIGPVLMVMITAVSDQLTEKFESGYGSSRFDSSFAFSVSTPMADIAGISEILTIVATACMGVTLSKINYFTVRHTMFVGIITLVAMALLYAVPYVSLSGLL